MTSNPDYLVCLDADEIKLFELTRGTITKMQQPIRTSDRMNRPNFGRNDPEVKLKSRKNSILKLVCCKSKVTTLHCFASLEFY